MKIKSGWHILLGDTVRLYCPECWEHIHASKKRTKALEYECGKEEHPDSIKGMSPELVFCDSCERSYWFFWEPEYKFVNEEVK